MNAVIKRISLGKRTVCVSDIHGHGDLFERLLKKVGYTAEDTLVLLGDLYTKGPRPHDTLRRIIEMSRSPNVHILRGNCEDILEYLLPGEAAWIEALPHILETDSYIFVHGGLPSETLEGLDAWACMKNDAFLEQGLTFSKWVVSGHWPVYNYCHTIPCHNPIVNEKQRIIAIDGGCVVNYSGQLNAFIMEDGAFAFEAADDYPPVRIEKAQEERGGTLNITWSDRAVEITEQGAEFSTARHIATGALLAIPTASLFTDWDGNISGCRCGTDYFLPVAAGETVSLVDEFSDRILAKKNGTVGWIMK
ncbi:MAG: metallophosphoesterase [Oscillospiraceae bacterium]|jgi:protein phosphatase|nr:metallophosphoesterase [Oscillospiraceae bacterium]